jgi:hypothetical protein
VLDHRHAVDQVGEGPCRASAVARTVARGTYHDTVWQAVPVHFPFADQVRQYFLDIGGGDREVVEN